MKMKYNYLIIFLFYFINFVKSIRIEAISFEIDDDGLFNTYVNDFNEYSKKNNLNITLGLTLFTSANSTVYTNSGQVTIQSLLASKSKKYDIYFFTFTHSPEYSDDLLDLTNYISPEIVNLYDSNLFRDTCIFDNKLVGFPANRILSVLYSNKKLMDKYNKPPPKTWEELYNTTSYILEEEKKLNHTSLLGYTGLFVDESGGSVSFNEMLYSYRKTKDSYYPDYKSQEAIDAMNMYKKLMTYASSGYDKIFGTIFTGESLFIKYYFYDGLYPQYRVSEIPGWREGISVSMLSGIDVGIIKYISEEKKIAAAKVLEFILSKEEQKKVVMQKKNIYRSKSIIL